MSRTTQKTDVFFNTLIQALLLKRLQVQLTAFPTGFNLTVRDLQNDLEVGMSYEFDTINKSDREPALMAVAEVAFVDESFRNAVMQRHVEAQAKEEQMDFAKAKKATAKKKPTKKAAPKKKPLDRKAIAKKAAATRKKNAEAKKAAEAQAVEPSNDTNVVPVKTVKTADNVLS